MFIISHFEQQRLIWLGCYEFIYIPSWHNRSCVVTAPCRLWKILGDHDGALLQLKLRGLRSFSDNCRFIWKHWLHPKHGSVHIRAFKSFLKSSLSVTTHQSRREVVCYLLLSFGFQAIKLLYSHRLCLLNTVYAVDEGQEWILLLVYVTMSVNTNQTTF